MAKEVLMKEKIEVRLHEGLKRAAEAASRQEGDGNVAAWVRTLIRAKVREMGIPVEEAPEAAGTPQAKPKRKAKPR